MVEPLGASRHRTHIHLRGTCQCVPSEFTLALQFLVKSDMLNSGLHFSNMLDCIETKYILWVGVCLDFMKTI